VHPGLRSSPITIEKAAGQYGLFFPKKNRDFRLSSLTLEMPEPAVLTNKPVSSSAATLLFRSGRINMLTYQPVLVLGTAEPESSAVVEAAAAAITSSL
jgi:hypothetical protein